MRKSFQFSDSLDLVCWGRRGKMKKEKIKSWISFISSYSLYILLLLSYWKFLVVSRKVFCVWKFSVFTLRKIENFQLRASAKKEKKVRKFEIEIMKILRVSARIILFMSRWICRILNASRHPPWIVCDNPESQESQRAQEYYEIWRTLVGNVKVDWTKCWKMLYIKISRISSFFRCSPLWNFNTPTLLELLTYIISDEMEWILHFQFAYINVHLSRCDIHRIKCENESRISHDENCKLKPKFVTTFEWTASNNNFLFLVSRQSHDLHVTQFSWSHDKATTVSSRLIRIRVEQKWKSSFFFHSSEFSSLKWEQDENNPVNSKLPLAS